MLSRAKSKRISRKPASGPSLLPAGASSPRSAVSAKNVKEVTELRSRGTSNVHQHTALGAKVWVPCRQQVWRLAKVLFADDDKGTITVQLEGSGAGSAQTTFALSQIRLFDEGQLKNWDDMSKMGDLNEASIIALLRRRFMNGDIYTLNGDILLSVNPYRDLPNMYDTYTGFERPSNKEKQQKPHLYAVADNAYQSMRGTDPDAEADKLKYPETDERNFCAQSILVNGESGAGKTEASKYIVRYLSHQSQMARQARMERDGNVEIEESKAVDGASSSVEQCVVQANPLLEAFGNAATVKNDNSSRYGKYTQVHYDTDGCIDGANTEHYLLEKSRVCEHNIGERSFHALYQLIAGLEDVAMRTEFGLGDRDSMTANEFVFLQSRKPVEAKYDAPSKKGAKKGKQQQEQRWEQLEKQERTAKRVVLGLNRDTDARGFQETSDAMSTVGITTEEQTQVWRVLAAVLWLGNITFEADADGCAVDEASRPNMERAAMLLGVSADDLDVALTLRTVRAGRRASVSVVKLKPEVAVDSRNGLAKAIYSQLFDWLVGKVNEATQLELNTRKAMRSHNADTRQQSFIGILDIFGFEVLDEGGRYEQFCINYANEVLQKEFDHHVFAHEQQLYNREGIDSSMLTFQDNAALLELFGKKHTGIFSIMDEQGMLGSRATDADLIRRIFETHSGKTVASQHSRFAKPRFDKESFIVKHYAGDVTYHIDGFMAKNNDALHHDLSTLLTTKTNENLFLQNMFKQSVLYSDSADATQHAITTLFTVGSRLRSQMQELVQTLAMTRPHFVRCLKPNETFSSVDFSAPHILNQLTFLGVMEAVRIRREGFPVRRTFEELATKYALLLSGTTVVMWTPPDKAHDVEPEEHEHARVACQTILMKVLGDTARGTGWQVGKSDMIFLREGMLSRLDEAVRLLLNRNATALQALMRRRRAQTAMKQKREAVTAIATRFRTHKLQQTYQAERTDVVQVQKAVRGHLALHRYKLLRKGAVAFAAAVRGKKGREEASDKRVKYTAAVMKIQQGFRMTGPYKEYMFIRMQTSKVQAIWRGTLVRIRWRRLQTARQPWDKFLRKNEAVALSSLVIKRTPKRIVKGILTSRKRRQLIMTTASPVPRFFYVDPKTMQPKGEIPYIQGKTEVSATSESDFVVHSPQEEEELGEVVDTSGEDEGVDYEEAVMQLIGEGTKDTSKPNKDSSASGKKSPTIWKFTDLLNQGNEWVEFVRSPITVMDMLSIGSVIGDNQQLKFLKQKHVVKQALLVKLAINSEKNWRKRWCVLYDSTLSWYKGQGIKKAKGSITIGANTVVKLASDIKPGGGGSDGDTSSSSMISSKLHDRKHCFQITTPSLEKALVLQCESAVEAEAWVDAIGGIIATAGAMVNVDGGK